MIVLVAGAPCSGKSWVCEQLKDKFLYIPHDNFKDSEYWNILIAAQKYSKGKPVLGEVPWNASGVFDELCDSGNEVRIIYVTASDETLKQRYKQRTGNAIPKQFLKTNERYSYRKPSGDSSQVLKILQALE